MHNIQFVDATPSTKIIALHSVCAVCIVFLLLLYSFTKLETMEYLPVKVKGQFLHDKEILIGPRALIDIETPIPRSGSLVSDPKRNQGWLVITPFMLAETG